MIELKILNCNDEVVERKFESANEFIRVMESENIEDEPLMLDDEIVELRVNNEKIDIYYLVNDLYNAYSE